MPTLHDVYLHAVGGDSESSLSMPGLAHVTQLLSQCGIVVSEEQLHELYEREKWSNDGLGATTM